MPEMKAPPVKIPRTIRKLTFDEIMKVANRKHITQELNECIPTSLLACVCMDAEMACDLPETPIDWEFDERMRKLTGYKENTVGGMSIDTIKRVMNIKKHKETIDAGKYFITFESSDIRKLNLDWDKIQETYLSRGRPVVFGLTFRAYIRGTFKDEPRNTTTFPGKHYMTALWADDKYIYAYNTKPYNAVGFPIGICKVERSLASHSAFDHSKYDSVDQYVLENDGVDYIYSVTPHVYKK